jgi:hypothetical protein
LVKMFSLSEFGAICNVVPDTLTIFWSMPTISSDEWAQDAMCSKWIQVDDANFVLLHIRSASERHGINVCWACIVIFTKAKIRHLHVQIYFYGLLCRGWGCRRALSNFRGSSKYLRLIRSSYLVRIWIEWWSLQRKMPEVQGGWTAWHMWTKQNVSKWWIWHWAGKMYCLCSAHA